MMANRSPSRPVTAPLRMGPRSARTAQGPGPQDPNAHCARSPPKPAPSLTHEGRPDRSRSICIEKDRYRPAHPSELCQSHRRHEQLGRDDRLFSIALSACEGPSLACWLEPMGPSGPPRNRRVRQISPRVPALLALSLKFVRRSGAALRCARAGSGAGAAP